MWDTASGTSLDDSDVTNLKEDLDQSKLIKASLGSMQNGPMNLKNQTAWVEDNVTNTHSSIGPSNGRFQF